MTDASDDAVNQARATLHLAAHELGACFDALWWSEAKVPAALRSTSRAIGLIKQAQALLEPRP
jgi:hypothetical protein